MSSSNAARPSSRSNPGPVNRPRANFFTATSSDGHVCTPACDGIASLPAEYHDSLLTHFTETTGRKAEGIVISSISLHPEGIVAGQDRYSASETEERRDIEINPQHVQDESEAARLPMALPTTFKYPPLPPGHGRFLRLVGVGLHPLAYLESHPLDKPPPYIAVSYCWDPTSERRTMFVNMESLPISATVLEVINQVCINQDDAAEKLDQVYRMDEIYSRAEKVYIWLGPTANQSDVAISQIKRMIGEVSVLAVAARISRGAVPDEYTTVINENHGQIYGHFFKRPWFQRLWTVQETLLARKLVVMCGYLDVELGVLAKLAQLILSSSTLRLINLPGESSEDHIHRALVGIDHLHKIRQVPTSTSGSLRGLDMGNFEALVAHTRIRQVTMAADRVHALMGVAPRKIRDYMSGVLRLQPDVGLWELYTHLAKCMLENDPSWHFLSQAPSKDRPSELPSWVPNINSHRPFASFLSGYTDGYSAGISPATQHLIKRTITTRELVAHGFRLDTVHDVISQTAFREDTQNMEHNDVYGPEVHNWNMACVQLCQQLYGIEEGNFPTHHVDVLLAQPPVTTRQVIGLRGRSGIDLYKIFVTWCQARDETLAILREGNTLPEEFRDKPDGIQQFADSFIKHFRNELEHEQYMMLRKFTARMKTKCGGRPYISAGTIRTTGLGCPGVRVGDGIYILYGTTVPYILRPRGDGSMEFIGDAYIYDAMGGDAMTWPERGPDEMIRIS
ncbi:hypothetical protein OQA88_2397 [Cercophora sp. LCS_1]